MPTCKKTDRLSGGHTHDKSWQADRGNLRTDFLATDHFAVSY